jgi:hypothetical protein
MNNDNNNERGLRGTSASKSRKQILLELLQLEGEDLGNVGKQQDDKEETTADNNETINAHRSVDDKRESNDRGVCPLTKPKKQLTEKQLETLKKGQEIRNANRIKRAEEKKIKEEQEKKELEEKLVKKAIALKKRQLKKQQLLDEISNDEEDKSLPHLTRGERGDPVDDSNKEIDNDNSKGNSPDGLKVEPKVSLQKPKLITNRSAKPSGVEPTSVPKINIKFF